MKKYELTRFENFKIWWKYEGRYFHLDFIHGIKNLFHWFKIVWKDRDYDDSFIFEALKFKIEKTARYTERRKFFVGWEREVSRMKICIELIKRIQDNYYGIEYLDYQESNSYFVESESKDKHGDTMFELKQDVITDNLNEYFKKYKNTHKEVLKGDVKHLSNDSVALKISNKNHEKAKKLLFTILNNHIENWWE